MSDGNRAATRYEIIQAVIESFSGITVSKKTEDDENEIVDVVFRENEAESLIHQLDIEGYEIRRKV